MPASFQMEEEKDYITQEELEDELEAERVPHQGRGNLALILGAILLLLAGSMTGYYYYTFQKERGSGNLTLRQSWENAILVANRLNPKLEALKNYPDFLLLADDFDRAQRTIRDTLIGLPEGTSTGLGGVKLAAFLDDYASALVESDKLIERGEEIATAQELNSLQRAFGSLEESYDEVLLAGRSFVKGSIPRSFFKFPDKLKGLLEEFLETRTESQKDESSARETAENFAQAFIDNDAEALGELATTATAEKVANFLATSSLEFSGFSILTLEKVKDKTEFSAQAQLKTQTPDGKAGTDNWELTMTKKDDRFLVSDWKQL